MALDRALGLCNTQCQSHRHCGAVLCPGESQSRNSEGDTRHTKRSLESNDCVRMECEGSRISFERRISSLPLYTCELLAVSGEEVVDKTHKEAAHGGEEFQQSRTKKRTINALDGSIDKRYIVQEVVEFKKEM
jgi:hypothetical protein